MENFADLLYLSDKYDAEYPMSACVEFMKKHITVDDFCWVMHLAIRYHCRELRDFCLKQIRRNWLSTVNSNGFLESNHKVVEELVRMYCVERNDQILLERCIEWAKRSCQRKDVDCQTPMNLRNELGALADLITIENMTFDECLNSKMGITAKQQSKKELSSSDKSTKEEADTNSDVRKESELPDQVDTDEVTYSFESGDVDDDLYFGWGDETEEIDYSCVFY